MQTSLKLKGQLCLLHCATNIHGTGRKYLSPSLNHCLTTLLGQYLFLPKTLAFTRLMNIPIIYMIISHSSLQQDSNNFLTSRLQTNVSQPNGYRNWKRGNALAGTLICFQENNILFFSSSAQLLILNCPIMALKTWKLYASKTWYFPLNYKNKLTNFLFRIVTNIQDM